MSDKELREFQNQLRKIEQRMLQNQLKFIYEVNKNECGLSKLTEKEVLATRAIKNKSAQQLAQLFNTCKSNILCILHRKTGGYYVKYESKMV